MDEFAAAYDKSRRGDRHGAVALLRTAAQARPAEARAHLARLERIVQARSIGEQCGCHVTKTLYGLLNEATNAG
jgi:hypothetical protein